MVSVPGSKLASAAGSAVAQKILGQSGTKTPSSPSTSTEPTGERPSSNSARSEETVSKTPSSKKSAAPAAKKAPATKAAAATAKKAPAKKAAAKKAPAKKSAAAPVDIAEALDVPAAGGAVMVDAQGKKVLPDISDKEFEKDLKNDPTLKEDEESSFTLSAADESDEPVQQVLVAGATADPVKDYLKQIGKVSLLTAGEEVHCIQKSDGQDPP